MPSYRMNYEKIIHQYDLRKRKGLMQGTWPTYSSVYTCNYGIYCLRYICKRMDEG